MPLSIGIRKAESNSVSQPCGKLILSGQFHARFEFGTRTVSQSNNYLFDAGGMFTATYHLFLYEKCLVLCREPVPGGSPSWSSRVLGIIDFRHGHLMTVSTERKKGSPLVNSLCTMIFEWTVLDRKLYKIALAPCNNLENGPAICESWIRAMRQTEFRNGIHNWPLIREEQVSFH